MTRLASISAGSQNNMTIYLFVPEITKFTEKQEGALLNLGGFFFFNQKFLELTRSMKAA